MRMDKQQHARRLKPLKPVLNPTVYQFTIWVINQKWGVDYRTPKAIYYKLWR